MRVRMTLLTLALLIAAIAAPLHAGPRNQSRDKSLSPAARKELSRIQALGKPSLDEIRADVDPARIETLTREILALDSLAVGTRAVDDQGRAAIHRYLRQRLDALQPKGVEYLGSLRGSVVAPVSVDKRLNPALREEPSSLTVNGQRYPVVPLWPNGPMPSLAPAAGLQGPLVYVARGQLTDVAGLDLAGAICLMDFAGGRNWEQLFSLGAQAVIVVEDSFVLHEKAELLFCNTPVPFPRFYVDKKIGATLIEQARQAGQLRAKAASLAANTADPAAQDQARQLAAQADAAGVALLRGGNVYEERPFESLFAYLPPSAAAVYRVEEDDLLARIAFDFGVNAQQLRDENRLEAAPLAPGQTLAIPNSDKTYTVIADDLLARLSSDYGVKASQLKTLNNITDGTTLPAGTNITIPNIPESMVLFVGIDSVSVAPDAPHGAQVAANIAVALATLEHLAASPTAQRRKGLVIGFLDADTLGGMTSRTFAQYALLNQGKLSNEQKPDERRYPIVLVAVLLTLGAGIGAGFGFLFSFGHLDKDGKPLHPARGMVIGGIIVGCFGLLIPTANYYIVGSVAGRESQSEIIEHYLAADRWLADPDANPLPHGQARWLADKWLLPRVEKPRITVAEERGRLEKKWRESVDPAEREQLRQQVESLRARQDMLVALRDDTIQKSSLDPQQRVGDFFTRLREAEAGGWKPEPGLSASLLAERLRTELAQEQHRLSESDNNSKVVQAVLGKLRHEGADATASVLGLQLFLSDESASVGFGGGSDFRPDAIAGQRITSKSGRRFRDVVAYASVKGEWPEDWTFLIDEDRADTPILPTKTSPAYGDFWSVGLVTLVPMATNNYRVEKIDTPRDLAEHLNFANLAVQARNVLLVTKVGLENPADSLVDRGRSATFGRLAGKALEFNVRSGLDAQDPVEGVYVYYPAIKKDEGDEASNTNSYYGVRKAVVMITLLNGSYVLPLETTRFNSNNVSKPVIYAYRLNRATALFDKVVDQGQIGTQKKTPDFALKADLTEEKNLILTDAYPLAYFPGPDPMDYKAIGDTKEGQYITVMDAVINGEPQHYATDNAPLRYVERDINTNLLYMPAGRRARVMVRRNITYKLLLVGPLSDQDSGDVNARGSGYMVGPRIDPANPPAGRPATFEERNLSLPMTPLLVARDMLALATARQKVLAPTGVRDQSVSESLVRAEEKLAVASAAADARDWPSAVGAARESWGMMVKVYPRILQLGREAVFSAVILMALLVPAAAFLEKLIIGAKGIIARLLGTVAIFALTMVLLRFIHAAFLISVSPFIVMIAFIMILMSSVVLVICYQRFEVLVRRARASGGEVEGEQISLVSSLSTALSLGVSNLKKRPARTALTAMTVSVLTFSIVTFVSVKGRDALDLRALSLDTQVEGRTVDAYWPKYEGVLFREYVWQALDDSFVSAVRSEFGTRYDVTVRGHYIQTEGGNNADREGVNQEVVRLGKTKQIITGLMAFEPNEPMFSGIDQALAAGRWFNPADRFAIILPDNVAAALGIKSDMIAGPDGAALPDAKLPVVDLMNNRWRVVGILNAKEADRYRDQTGRSLAMVDYLKSAFTKNMAGDIANESDSYYMSWDKLAIVPMAAAADVRIKPRSVAIRFRSDDQAQRQQFRRDLELRVNRTMFGIVDGELALITTKNKTDIGGLAKIIVPVILCILIVLNTMLGAVEERKGEVSMLGAVGLSPSQISFLLLSESMVFSVLGIVFGTISGLLFANIMKGSEGAAGGLFSDLSFNFTSLASMALAMGTGVVVLLATLLPARRAAALAAPSGMASWVLPEPNEQGQIQFILPFTLTRGNAVGMTAFFRRFLLNHTDATSSDFNCRHVRLLMDQTGAGALMIRADMWLAPYDLDVSQHFQMRVVPTENAGVFAVELVLERNSGTEEAWLRTNYGFLNLVRYQFLLWRNLDDKVRQGYINEGAGLFRQEAMAG